MNLGELLIKLGVSEDEYWAQLQKIKQQTAKVGADIEKSLGNVKLTIDVNDKELTGLNKHLDLKVSHHKKVQSHFDSNPLTVKVDDRALKTLNQRLADLERGITIPIGIDTKSVRVSADSPSGAKGTDRIVKAIEAQGKKSAGEKVAGAIAAPIKAAGSVVKSTIGTIATGSLEKVGRDLSADLSEGLSSGLRQELSYTIGSLDYIGEEIGKDVIKGIISSLGRDGQAIEQAIAQAIGQPVINREGAAVRGQSAEKRSQKNASAKAQSAREFAFFQQNLPEINQQKGEAAFDRKRLQLNAKRVQIKIDEFAEKLGQASIQDQVSEIDEAIAQISKDSGQAKDPAQIESLANKAKQLTNSRSRLLERLDSIREVAEARFEAEIKTIQNIDDQIIARERQLGQYAQAAEGALELGVRSGAKAAKRSPASNPDFFNELAKGARPIERSPASNPDFFNELAKEVAKVSDVAVSAATIPQLRADPELAAGTRATYRPGKNLIAVPEATFKAIENGKATADQIEDLVHELRHSVQFAFGTRKIAQGADPSLGLLSPNRSEARKLGRRIEASTDAAPGDPAAQQNSRAIEQDAYVFAERFTKQIAESLKRQTAEASVYRERGHWWGSG